ncbi:hypothetical protein [Streptomyces luteireticuli]|uniref:Uncharacterized protein n=1 Tax=Streptomyces luteireticuli TaxID=173858 RepID=A0ABP3I3U6_9ACTN
MRTTVSLCTLTAVTAVFLAGPAAAAADPQPAADVCGSVNSDYTHGKASKEFTGTVMRNGEQDQMSVTFWSGPPSTVVTIAGNTMNDTTTALGQIDATNGLGTFSFMTPDGWAAKPVATCASGSTLVTAIEGTTANNSAFKLTAAPD